MHHSTRTSAAGPVGNHHGRDRRPDGCERGHPISNRSCLGREAVDCIGAERSPVSVTERALSARLHDRELARWTLGLEPVAVSAEVHSAQLLAVCR
jgi:hypothetical protein